MSILLLGFTLEMVVKTIESANVSRCIKAT